MGRKWGRALFSLLASLFLSGCWDHGGRRQPGHPGDRPHHHRHHHRHDRQGPAYDQGAN